MFGGKDFSRGKTVEILAGNDVAKLLKYLAGKICHAAKLLKYWRETTRRGIPRALYGKAGE
jgi:hypothetical protein